MFLPFQLLKYWESAIETIFNTKFNPISGLNLINLNERITPTTRAKEGLPKKLNTKSKFLKAFKFPNKVPIAINITGTIIGIMDSLNLKFFAVFDQKTNWHQTLIYCKLNMKK